MRHAVKVLSVSGLTICAALSGCSILNSEDDSSSGGSSVTIPMGGSTVGVGNGGASSTTKGGGSSTAGNSSSTGGGSGTSPDACESIEGINVMECGASSVSAQIKTVNMMLVIDRSGSMANGLDGTETGVPSKWDGLQQALAQALPTVQSDINFGMIAYPSTAAASAASGDLVKACEVDSGTAAVAVPITTGAAAVASISSKLKSSPPAGGTPTAEALRAAYVYFTSGEGLTKAGDKYVLLATDGGPNCNSANTCDNDATKCTLYIDSPAKASKTSCNGYGLTCLDADNVLTQIKALADKGIQTFVVGVPGTEAYAQYLDQFAEAGGRVNPTAGATTKYYKVEASGGVKGLVDVFSTITTQLVRSCDIKLDSTPPDRSKVNVAIDCKVVPQTDDSWALDDTNPDQPMLLLKGQTCMNIQATGAKRVDVVYGCATLK
ncbi:MAG: vWA domain-containing protein [Polyangiaceae bacterium]